MLQTLAAPTLERLAKHDLQLLRIWHLRLLRNWSQIELRHQTGAVSHPVGAIELTRVVEALTRRGLCVVTVLNPPKGFGWTADNAPFC